MNRVITLLFCSLLKTSLNQTEPQLWHARPQKSLLLNVVVLYNRWPGLTSTSKKLPPKTSFLHKNTLKFCSRTAENVLGIINIQRTWTSVRISSKSFSLNTVLLQIHPLPSGKWQAKFLGPFNLLGAWGGVLKTNIWINTLLRPGFFSVSLWWQNEQSYSNS